MSSGYYNHSPPSGSQYPGSMGAMDSTGGSYSPPHNLSPKGLSSSSGVNGYNSVSVGGLKGGGGGGGGGFVLFFFFSLLAGPDKTKKQKIF